MTHNQRPPANPARFRLPSSVHQGTVALYGLTCAATIGFVMSRSAEPAGLAYFCAGLVVMSFTINLVGMNPPIAGALCVAITLTTSALSAGSRFGSTGVVVTHLVFGAMVTVVATFANWCLLNQRRRAFLMHRRAEEQLRRIAEQRDLLERMAAIDPLTELPNRRGFDDLLVRDLAAAAEGSPLAVAMVDVDCFKAFNDGYGHPSGDAALRAIVGALREACGPGGRVGRLGGEEFGVVVLSGAADDLPTLGERLREAVETLSIPHRWSGVAPCVTISVGLVGPRIKDGRRDCADLFALADEALYDAKRSGRNRSTSFADEHDVNAIVVIA